MADPDKKEAPDDDAGDEKKPRPGSSHWWEQYTVRYFIGTVIGVFVIFLLRTHGPMQCEIQELIPPLADIDAKKLAAVTALGLAFCYVASAPILTLHAVRGSMALDRGEFIVALLVFVTSPIWIAFISDYFGSGVVSIVALLIIVGGQCVLIIVASVKRFGKLKAFYDDLIEARLRNWVTKRDYVDSYRHLREHGNALAIVFCEIALGAILASPHEKRDGLIILALWVAPGAWCWVIGSVLENHFANTKPSPTVAAAATPSLPPVQHP